jgi:hypothetical protein
MDNIVDNDYLKYYFYTIVYDIVLYYFKLLLCGWLICY